MAAKKKDAAKVAEPPEPLVTNEQPAHVDWRDPDAKFAADDESLEARLWRMAQRQEGK